MLTLYQKQSITFACLILITGLLAMDFINPSLPYIMRSLHTNEMQTKLLMVYYMLGLSISQFFYGTFSDNHGRKKTMLLSYIISIMGILLSIFAHSIIMLQIARFINGLGNGGATVTARAVISDVCTDTKTLKQGFAYFTIFGMISPTFGPIIGGFIQQYSANWRLCFIVLLAVTLISAIIIKLYMPETHIMPSLKTSFTQQTKVYLSLIKLKRFMLYNFSSAMIYIFSIAYYAYMPFILFKLNFSPIENGVLYGVYATSLIIGAMSLAKFLNRQSSRITFVVCCSSFILTSILFLIYFSFLHSALALTLLTIIIAFTCGIAAPLTLSLSMGEFSSGQKGAASAVQSFMKMFFTGIALLLFNFIPLKTMSSLLSCYVIISVIMIFLLIIDQFVIKYDHK